MADKNEKRCGVCGGTPEVQPIKGVEGASFSCGYTCRDCGVFACSNACADKHDVAGCPKAAR